MRSVFSASSAAISLVLALSLPACLAAPAGHEDDPAGTSQDAWTEQKAATWAKTPFDDFVAALRVDQLKIQVRDGAGTIVPSQPMANLIAKEGESSDPAAHTETFSVPSFHKDLGTGAPTVDAVVSNLDASNIAVTLTSSALLVSFDVAGKIFVHESGIYPNFDVVVNPSTFTISLSFHDGLLTVDTVTGSLDTSVHECGAFGWCDGLVESLLPDFSGKVRAGLKIAGNKAIQKPSAQSTLLKTLLAFSGHLGETPAWTVVPTSPHIDAVGISYKLTREQPPVAPTNVSAKVRCGDDVDITWDANPDWIRITRTDPDGTATVLGPDGINAPAERHDYRPPGPTATYQVCAYSALGSACAPSFTVGIPHTACGGTSGGTGTKTGCVKLSSGKMRCYATGD